MYVYYGLQPIVHFQCLENALLLLTPRKCERKRERRKRKTKKKAKAEEGEAADKKGEESADPEKIRKKRRRIILCLFASTNIMSIVSYSFLFSTQILLPKEEGSFDPK